MRTILRHKYETSIKRSDTGFGMIELLISIAVLSIGIASAATAFSSTQQLSARFGDVNQALSISEGFLEESSMHYSSSPFFDTGTRTFHYDKHGRPSLTPSAFKLEFRVSPSDIAGLVKIEIRVSWLESGDFEKDINLVSYRAVR